MEILIYDKNGSTDSRQLRFLLKERIPACNVQYVDSFDNFFELIRRPLNPFMAVVLFLYTSQDLDKVYDCRRFLEFPKVLLDISAADELVRKNQFHFNATYTGDGTESIANIVSVLEKVSVTTLQPRNRSWPE